MKNRFLIFVALAVTLMRPQESQAINAYVLDTSGLGDVGELYLLGSLQGIVNRDAPRLFLTKGAANTVYADYLEREKGFTFT
ncbi:MAG: GxGYxYP domain-containing protein, partial [bacterium]